MGSVHSLAYSAEYDRSVFQPTREDYADFKVPFAASFKLRGIFEHKKAHNPRIVDKIGLVVFRSIPKVGADVELLKNLDEAARIAAESAEGFLQYEPFVSLSYCLWHTLDNAEAGVRSPEHAAAARYAKEAYEDFRLIRGWLLQSPVDGTVDLIEVKRS